MAAEDPIPAISSSEPPAPIQPIVAAPSGDVHRWKIALVLSGSALLQIAAQFFSNYLTARGYVNMGVARFFLFISGTAISLVIILCVKAFDIRRKRLVAALGIALVVVTSGALEFWAPKPLTPVQSKASAVPVPVITPIPALPKQDHSQQIAAPALTPTLKSPPSGRQPAKAPPSIQNRLTVHKLFLEDFNHDSFGFGFAPRELSSNNGENITIESRLLVDLDAGTKFVAIYIPQSPFAYGASIFLADNYEEVGGLKLFHLEIQMPHGTVFTEDFRFSGRIFIYHETNFTPEQIGDLHKLYRQHNLLLELRGQNYAEAQILVRELKRKNEKSR